MKKDVYILPAFALFYTIFHLLFYNTLEYHRDELFYYLYGNHLSAGYSTSPPLTGFVSFILVNLFGYSQLALKMVPAVTGGIMVMVTAEISKELGGGPYARILSAVAFIASIFALRTFSLFMPVQFDILFWTLSILLLLKYFNHPRSRYLTLLGVVAGLGLMNKYLIALLFVVLLVIIPFTPHRDVFRKKPLYIGVGLAFIIFLPNLVWQIKHGLPGIRHIEMLYDDQLGHVDRLNFLMEQLMMPFMASLLTVPGIIHLFSQGMKKFRWLGITSLAVITILLLIRGKHYYTLGVFPALIAAGAVMWEKVLKTRLVRAAFPVCLVAVTLPILPMGIPVFKTEKLIQYFRMLDEKYGVEAGRRFEDGTIHSLPQDYADMIGWQELADLAGEAWQQTDNSDRCIIYCENYGQASAIAVLGKKYGLPEPVSFHDSFLRWIPQNINPEVDEFIYVNHELGPDVAELFSDIREIGRISNPHAREYGAQVYLCKKPVSNFYTFLNTRISQVKQAYR